MKAAFATWQGRIAPLFETSRQAHIVTVLPDGMLEERGECFQEQSPVGKILCLVEWEVNTVICGAISRQVQAIAAAHGIHVIPFVAGDLRAVIQAWIDQRIGNAEYAMPGCGRRTAGNHKNPLLPPRR